MVAFDSLSRSAAFALALCGIGGCADGADSNASPSNVAGGGSLGMGGVSTGGVSTGGVSTGGVSTGGAPAATGGVPAVTGGSSATGGVAGAPSGGATSGGASGGNPSASGGTSEPTPSTGCGATAPPESGRFSIDVDGTMREYILAVPDDYDSSSPYRIIFAWHPRGGSAEQVATGFGGGYYGLESLADGSAIFVSPEGIDMGWANTGGRDIAFLRAMLDRFQAELCIDESRIFSTGFSYGGMMSYAIGCAMGDVFRAIAPMSGAIYSGCEDGDHPIAMWGSHGDNDTVVPLENGESARDVFLERNHCQAQTTPVEPSPCVSYEGCDAGYPVVWCEFSGGHALPSNSADSIWDFLSQF